MVVALAGVVGAGFVVDADVVAACLAVEGAVVVDDPVEVRAAEEDVTRFECFHAISTTEAAEHVFTQQGTLAVEIVAKLARVVGAAVEGVVGGIEAGLLHRLSRLRQALGIRTSENPQNANFALSAFYEVRA